MRLVLSGQCSATFNMAADEFLFLSGSPCLRIYAWKPHAVSIGYFQKLEDEVTVAECARQAVDIVRRRTGGGAVYHDAELTYSLVVPQALVSADLYESYADICSCVVSALSSLGINASFRPVNDVVVGARKISGNAQTRTSGVVFQHGTILMSINPERMFSLLRVGDEKMRDKMVRSIWDYVTSVEKELGCSVSFGELSSCVENAFAQRFGSLSAVPFSSSESAKIREIMKKYSSEKWNNWR